MIHFFYQIIMLKLNCNDILSIIPIGKYFEYTLGLNINST